MRRLLVPRKTNLYLGGLWLSMAPYDIQTPLVGDSQGVTCGSSGLEGLPSVLYIIFFRLQQAS